MSHKVGSGVKAPHGSSRTRTSLRILALGSLTGLWLIPGCAGGVGQGDEPLGTTQQLAVSGAIRVNEAGYVPGATKIAVVVNASATGLAFKLVSSTGTCSDTGVFSGTTTVFGNDPAAGDNVHQANFTSFATPGNYKICVGTDESYPFAISSTVFNNLPKHALKYFYFARTGKLESQYLTDFASAAHARIALRPNDSAVGSYLGWTSSTFNVKDFHMDAGDVGTYGENHAMGMWLLENMFETFKTSAASYNLNIPPASSLPIPLATGTPDILNEISYSANAAMAMLQCTPGAGSAVTCVSGTGLSALGAHKVGHYNWFPYVKNSFGDWGVFSPWREAYCDYSDINNVPPNGGYSGNGIQATFACTTDADCVAGGAVFGSATSPICLPDSHQCRNDCQSHLLRQVSKPSTGATLGYVRYLAHLARLLYPYDATKALQFWNAAENAYGRAKTIPFRHWFANMTDPKTDPNSVTQNAAYYSAANLTPWTKKGCSDATCGTSVDACATAADCTAEKACTVDSDCDQDFACISNKCKWDYNGDGVVNSSDVMPMAACQAVTAYEMPGTVSAKACVYDYDGNGVIDSGDWTSPRGSGPYDDPSVGDDRYAAASEMYLTAYALGDSDKATYKTDLTGNIYYPNGGTGHKGVERGDWSADALFGTISLLTAPNDLTSAEISTLTSKFTAYADFEKTAIETQGYPSAIPPHANFTFGWPDAEGPDDTAGDGDAGEYRWGSNKDQAYAGMVLVQAYRLTGNTAYLRDAYRMMDYLLGTNPMGASYVTGWGANAYAYAHHRHGLYSQGVNGAAYPKGWLVGGPISTSKICGYDETVTPKGTTAKAKKMAPNTSDAAENAWCSMEVTIDWNGGLAWLAYALDQVYATTLGGSCTPETDTAFCSRLGKNCNSVTASDNCGAARTVNCGTCTSPATCAGGGVSNVCGTASCTAETDTAFCTRVGKNCGTVTANDNCGTSRTVTSCGTCTAPQTCGGAGTSNVCETPTCTCADDGNPCTVDACNGSGVCQHNAGNAGAVCRAANGACDVAETCNGTSTTCPTDAFAASSVVCRSAVAGGCDNAENCTGTSSACPADSVKASGTVCRASAGTCDVAETCNGTANTCPADAFAASSTVCRASAGSCDVAENCAGNAASCPADGFAASGTVCSGGTCNGSGACTAGSANIALNKPATADTFQSANPIASGNDSSTTSRWCGSDANNHWWRVDLGGTYNITGALVMWERSNTNYKYKVEVSSNDSTWTMASDQTATASTAQTQNLSFTATGRYVRITTTTLQSGVWASFFDFQVYGTASGCTCADDGNPCTVDACDANNVCQHTAGNAGAVCRASANTCDVAETCSGSSTSCPADAFLPSSTVCRAAIGTCDNAENCTGTSAACPTDSVKASGTSCRASAGTCDVAETCNGTSGACPTDAFSSSSTVCRTAAGPCDNAENCSGTAAACPADALKASGTVCRAAATLCDVAETCNGTASTCPTDAFAASSTIARAAATECDVAENCSGSSSTIPTDAFKASGTTCTGGTCNGTGTCNCAAPAAPTGFTATAGVETVVLQWSAVANTTYTVRRGTTSGGPYVDIATGIGSTTYVNTLAYTNTLPSGTYFYVVAAVTSCGTSANSTQASAMPSNAPPVTSALIAPLNNATYTVGTAINMTATATDTSYGSISKVEFYQGSTLLGTATTSPYTYSWTNAAAGTYSLTAKAYDNLNATLVSAPVSITVNGSGTNPCAGLCTTPTVFAAQSFSSGNLGSGAICYEHVGALGGANFGNFVAPRTISVNGTSMGSAGGNITLPAMRNGGYCFQSTAGSYDWAYFGTW